MTISISDPYSVSRYIIIDHEKGKEFSAVLWVIRFRDEKYIILEIHCRNGKFLMESYIDFDIILTYNMFPGWVASSVPFNNLRNIERVEDIFNELGIEEKELIK